MNEKRIELPSGGIAWLTTIASHAQSKTMSRVQTRLARFIGRDNKLRADLSESEQDALDDLLIELNDTMVSTFVVRWEDVRAPSGDPLELGDSGVIDRMQERDVTAIVASVKEALEAGRPDPNASRRRSGSTPGTARRRSTRSSANSSPTS